MQLSKLGKPKWMDLNSILLGREAGGGEGMVAGVTEPSKEVQGSLHQRWREEPTWPEIALMRSSPFGWFRKITCTGRWWSGYWNSKRRCWCECSVKKLHLLFGTVVFVVDCHPAQKNEIFSIFQWKNFDISILIFLIIFLLFLLFLLNYFCCCCVFVCKCVYISVIYKLVYTGEPKT